MNISAVIHDAMEAMEKVFGDMDIHIISEEMYRSNPTKSAPLGKLGVDIEIQDIETFLSCEIAEEMLSPDGTMIIEKFVYNTLKNIHNDESNMYIPFSRS